MMYDQEDFSLFESLFCKTPIRKELEPEVDGLLGLQLRSEAVPYNVRESMDFSSPPTIVIVYVGPNLQPFYVAEYMLSKHSLFFQKSFCGIWLESITNTMKLEDVEPIIFNILLGWCRNHNLQHPSRDYISLLEFGKLWTLADRFLMRKLQNACIDKMWWSRDLEEEIASSELAPEQIKCERTRDIIAHAWETEEDSALKRLCTVKLIRTMISTTNGEDFAHQMLDECFEDHALRRMVHILIKASWESRDELKEHVRGSKEDFYIKEI